MLATLKAKAKATLRRRFAILERPSTRRLQHKVLLHWKMPRAYEALQNIRVRLYGRSVRLEGSSVCQLKCPACSTASGKNKRNVIGWGMLKLDHFRGFLDRNPDVKTIEMSNWGEIFLNPYLKDMMAYAHERKVALRATNGVNLNNVKDHTLEALVKYRFRHMTVSIDGASHETYKQYRVKGSYNRVMRNIERINHYKKKYNSEYPKMTWQFVVFGHNEHELDTARARADELGMAFKPKLNHTPTFSPVRDKEHVRKASGIGAASRGELMRKGKWKKRACVQLWDAPQINWDGELLGCCVNKWGSFGNVFEQGLDGAMSNETYRYAKRMVLGLEPSRDDIPCVKCKVYQRQILGVGDPDEKVSLKKWKNRPAPAPPKGVVPQPA